MAHVTRTGDTFAVHNLSKAEFVALYEFLNDENDVTEKRVVVDDYLSNRAGLIEDVEVGLFEAYLSVVEEEADEA